MVTQQEKNPFQLQIEQFHQRREQLKAQRERREPIAERFLAPTPLGGLGMFLDFTGISSLLRGAVRGGRLGLATGVGPFGRFVPPESQDINIQRALEGRPEQPTGMERFGEFLGGAATELFRARTPQEVEAIGQSGAPTVALELLPALPGGGFAAGTVPGALTRAGASVRTTLRVADRVANPVRRFLRPGADIRVQNIRTLFTEPEVMASQLGRLDPETLGLSRSITLSGTSSVRRILRDPSGLKFVTESGDGAKTLNVSFVFQPRKGVVRTVMTPSRASLTAEEAQTFARIVAQENPMARQLTNVRITGQPGAQTLDLIAVRESSAFRQTVDVVKKIHERIRLGRGIVKETRALRVPEVRGRFAAAEEARRAGELPAEQAAIQARGKLTGELPRVILAEADNISPIEVNALFERVRVAPISTGAYINANSGMFKLLTTYDAEALQASELKALVSVFGEPNVRLWSGAGAREFLIQVFDAPRALMASFDMSAPLRQGLFLSIAHPIEGARAWKAMFEALDPDRAVKIISDINTRPLASLSDDAGLAIRELGGGAAGEELFRSQLAQRLPFGIGAMVAKSEAVYTVFLNKIRADTFDTIARGWFKAGKNPTKGDFKALAQFINIATGRGDMSWLGRNAELLDLSFFAPRLFVSRFQLPFAPLLALKGGSRLAAQQAARDLVASTGVMIGVMSLLDLSGVVEVGWDPTNPDFGKIKVGPQRFDLLGGAGPMVRMITQIALAHTTKAGTGETTPFKRLKEGKELEIIGRFFRAKLAPIPSIATDLYYGQTFLGDRIEGTVADAWEVAINRLTPLFWQDVWEAFREEGMVGAFQAAPGFFGIGVQTYTALGDAQERISKETFNGTSFKDLTKGERDRVNASPEVDQILQGFEDNNLPLPDSTRAEATSEIWRLDKKNSEKELRDQILLGFKGADLDSAIQGFRASRADLADLLFGQYLEGREPFARDTLADIWAEKYWTVELSRDPDTNDYDYITFDKDKAAVLEDAVALGVPAEYITGTGLGTYRGVRHDDLLVRSYVEEWERDLEELRRYYDIGRDYTTGDPARDEAWLTWLSADRWDRQELEDRYQLMSMSRRRTRERARLRKTDPLIEELLVKWGRVSP